MKLALLTPLLVLASVAAANPVQRPPARAPRPSFGSLRRRAEPCSSLVDSWPSSYSGANPTPDNGDVFTSFPDFALAAKRAVTPADFTQTFVNTASMAWPADGFHNAVEYPTYDIDACAAKCRAEGCKGFNLLFRRWPKRDVDPNLNDNTCTIPSDSMTVLECWTHGGEVTKDSAIIQRGISNGFDFALAGSNGYLLTPGTPRDPPTLTGFQAPHPLGNCLVNAPSKTALPAGIDTFIMGQSFTGSDYNVCATGCQKVTSDNQKAAARKGSTTYKSCNYFVAGLTLDGTTQTGVRCAYYTKDWSSVEGVKAYQNCGQGSKKFDKVASYLIEGYSEPTSRTEIP